ncbi:TPM domain-containing protein [Paenibacillaceae bacterium WGS1546]|uniref:TPM domain-containing protein n=1 Tax=Cohnella sp. WGS1546 TaxID=3366810 RepID=UPI00372D1973
MLRLRNRIAAAGLLLLALFVAAAGTSAQGAYGVYVQDGAGAIPGQTQAELYQRAVWLHEASGTAQVGVVTVPSLDGRPIEEAAVAKFRELGLGSREKNDGALLFYAAEEGRVRLEVGYGLEGRIPDGKAGAILDRDFVPYRDAGNLAEAFSRTQSAIVAEVAEEYGLDASGVVDVRPGPIGADDSGSWFADVPGYVKFLFAAVVVLLIFLDFKFTGGAVTFSILHALGRRGRSGGGGYGGGRGGGGSSGGGGASR